MKFDSFLTSPRWEILQILATTPSSPIELAQRLGTTVAYMSQQLKLLDAANLILKTKTGAAEKGKPRSVYRLSHDFLYFASLNKNFSDKKLLFSTDYHQIILRIWLIEDTSLHPYFERLYWLLYENKENLEKIYLDLTSPKFLVVSDSKKLKLAVQQQTKDFPKSVVCDFVSKFSISDKTEATPFVPIYDPFLLGEKVKGGLEKKHE